MWPNSQFSVDLGTFTKEIVNGKLHFLCSENIYKRLLLFQSANTASIVLVITAPEISDSVYSRKNILFAFFTIDIYIIFLYLGILVKSLRCILMIFKFSVMIWPYI